MNKDEALTLLGIIKITYPYAYKEFSKDEILIASGLWAKAFDDIPYKKVDNALKSYISLKSLPPTPADIKKIIFSEYQDNLLSNEEAWEILKRSARIDYDLARNEYNNLPDEIKSITTINTLQEIGKATDDDIQYLKRDFINAYKEAKAKITEMLLIGTNKENMDLLDFQSDETIENEDYELPYYD